MTQDLPEIPFVDARRDGTLGHARGRLADALALRDACTALAPGLGRLVPLADALCRRWLDRTESPYKHEVAALADIVGPGVYAINTSFEWGCTTRVTSAPGEAPRIRRTLDWPFRGLGRHVGVALQSGPAGEYLNVTWPGAVGVLTATAPGRFCATINQAPLRRRLPGRALSAADVALQAVATWRGVTHMPSAHLLRLAFDTAPDYGGALRLLTEVPVARPTLFALAGPNPGEACLVERDLDGARVHPAPVTLANDWQVPDRTWQPRGLGPDHGADNRARIAALASADDVPGFGWVAAPVLCARTRLAVEMDATGRRLEVLGYEPPARGTVPAPATRAFSLDARVPA